METPIDLLLEENKVLTLAIEKLVTHELSGWEVSSPPSTLESTSLLIDLFNIGLNNTIIYKEECTLLKKLIASDKLELFKHLLSFSENSALFTKELSKLIHHLIERKASPDFLIHLLKMHQDNEIILELNILNIVGLTPLMLAVESNYPVIEALCNAGASIETANEQGYTVLLIAAKYSNLSAFKTLLNFNADITKANHLGNNVCTYAYAHVESLCDTVI